MTNQEREWIKDEIKDLTEKKERTKDGVNKLYYQGMIDSLSMLLECSEKAESE